MYSVGVDCFDLVSASEAAAGDDRVEVDAEAVEATFQHLKHTRISKAAAYYNDPNTFFELGLFAALLDIYDSLLLYPMLGDPIGKSSGGGSANWTSAWTRRNRRSDSVWTNSSCSCVPGARLASAASTC